jgi:hypothetical protein
MLSCPRQQKYRNLYAKLLRLYPKAYRDRFAFEMDQTFNDLCRERLKSGQGLFAFAFETYCETFAAILRENSAFFFQHIMNRSSTLFLRLVIALMAIAALAICGVGVPRMVADETSRHPDGVGVPYAIMVCAYILCIPFFTALYQGFRVLKFVDCDKSFSAPTAKSLRLIRYCALVIGASFFAGIVILRIMSAGTGEDSAGPTMIAMVVMFFCLTITAVSVVLEKQVQKAINLKTESLR